MAGDRKGQKRQMHAVLLAIGIITTIVAQCFGIRDPHGYTIAALAFVVLSQPIAYFIILSIVALVAAATQKDVRRLWFPILAWLFLVAGLFDLGAKIVVKVYIAFVLSG